MATFRSARKQRKIDYTINHQLECNEKCLVYLLTCKKCVGQTIDTFRHHWNNYKSNDRNALNHV